MVNLSVIQTLFVLLLAFICSMVVAQSAEQTEFNNRFQANGGQIRERKATNQMRNMMRIGRRSDPMMPRMQPNMLYDYNNNNNEIDYSHLFRPNGFF